MSDQDSKPAGTRKPVSRIPETPWIWRDGNFIPWRDATLHVMSHVVTCGSNVFEGIRCYATPGGPAIFRIREHIRRLFDSARTYRIEIPYTPADLIEACAALVLRNELESCYLRPLVLRGYGALGLNPEGSPIETFLICYPWGTYLGDGALERGVDVCVSSWRRPAPSTVPTMAKAGGHYLNAQLMKMEANANGFVEAIALRPDGLVSEGSGENLFLVRGGALITSPVDGSMLEGITRDSVLAIAQDLGIPVRLQAIPREMLYAADELFFAGTAVEITPIRSVDRIPISDGVVGEVTKRLQREFFGIARGELADRHHWLMHVNRAASLLAR